MLGGGNSTIFSNFHPETWGRFPTHFDEQIFSDGLNRSHQPPTTKALHVWIPAKRLGSREGVGMEGFPQTKILLICWWFRNPAKQLTMVNIPLFTWFYTSQVGCLGFLPSTVWVCVWKACGILRNGHVRRYFFGSFFWVEDDMEWPRFIPIKSDFNRRDWWFSTGLLRHH